LAGQKIKHLLIIQTADEYQDNQQDDDDVWVDLLGYLPAHIKGSDDRSEIDLLRREQAEYEQRRDAKKQFVETVTELYDWPA
jgi:hypothetical protein